MLRNPDQPLSFSTCHAHAEVEAGIPSHVFRLFNLAGFTQMSTYGDIGSRTAAYAASELLTRGVPYLVPWSVSASQATSRQQHQERLVPPL